MSQNFLQGIDLPENVYAGGNLIVSHQKGNADGGFILHHLLADFVKRYGVNSEVLLVLCDENVNHWSAISSKLGWNLNSHAAKGALTVVDLTQDIYKTLAGNFSINKIQHVTEEINVDLNTLFHDCKEKIYSRVQKNSIEVDDGPQKMNMTGVSAAGKKFLVIVDDLTTLQYGSSNTASLSGEKNTLNFIRNLLNLCDTLKSEHSLDISIATCVNSSGGLFSSTVAQILSTVLFEISPLQTGYSQLFSGYITVKHRNVDTCRDSLIKSYQYKLDERQVKFSPLTKYNF